MNESALKNIFLLPALCILLIASIFMAATFGNIDISLNEVWNIIWSTLVGIGVSDINHDVIWLLRLPRIVLAALVGAGLAVCGVIMQAIVKNPLADPYILGISSGASLGATLAILLGIGSFFGENFVGITAALGAFAVSIGVLILSNSGGRSNSMKLLLAGMALSAVCSAFSSFIVYFSNDKEGMQSITYWLMGSLAAAKWDNLAIIFPITILGIGFFISQSRILNLMLLGDEAAITLGTDLHRYRHVYLLISAIMIGFIVYSSGVIGFVGLVVPHVIRMLVGTDHKILVPIAAVSGSIFLVWSDVLCRTIIPRTELPIGILISIIGAPCFVYLMVKRTYGFGGN